MDRLQAPAAFPPPSHPHRTQIPNTSSPFLIQTSSLIDDSWLSTVDSWLTVDFNFWKREQGFGCFIEKT
ncbi:hypothetical protein OIU84_000064 [Salix udensis]|uniref:Uncharacterized protein n=1 Tax=Salix udensis TaxID=889485 RepID=A0AAD6L3X8_9ROSI|nr:hypothetical protein OIU84_000064 [Salix udensis]